MDVSVIIVNYNTKELTMNCIKSVYSSKTQYSYEIIVVDNDSSDGSADSINRFYPEVKLIENKSNIGFGRANNQAAGIAKGRYLYVLNSDTTIENDVIERVVSYGDSNQSVGVIGTKVINPDGKLQENFYKSPSFLSELVFFTGSIIKSLNWFPFHLNKYKKYPLNKPFEVDTIAGCSMFIKRKVYEATGLFDEKFFMYYEDSEFCYRARQHGFKNVYFPEVVVTHNHMGSGKDERQKFITHITCFKSACIYFKCINKTFRGNVFKLISILIWLVEFSLFNVFNLFIRKEKLLVKTLMLKMLLAHSVQLNLQLPKALNFPVSSSISSNLFLTTENNRENPRVLTAQQS